MIGIIGAMDIEIEHIINKMDGRQSETVSGITYTKGTIEGRHVVAAVCGIGKVFAAVCAQTMILRYCPDAIINTGVAGTLTPQLGVLDTVVASSVVQHDMDTTFFGDEPGLISGINIVRFPCDGALSSLALRAVSQCGRQGLSGIIASGDCFVAAKEKKAFISDTFGAAACEMEGGAIGQVCYINNIPFTVIRTISDGADDGAPLDYASFKAQAARNSAETVIAILKEINTYK